MGPSPDRPDEARGETTGAVLDGEVVTVVWRQYAPKQVELVFADGREERVVGDYRAAARMAGEGGMRRVASPLGMVRWTRDLPVKGGRRPKRIGPWLTT